MKKVFQRIDDPKRGDCFKCCICSILELDYDAVPNFIEFPDDTWFTEAVKFFKQHGYELTIDGLENPNVHFLENPTENCFKDLICNPERSLERLKPEDGIDGVFLASVYSPGFTNAEEAPWMHLHSVLCDIDFNIIHDPKEAYADVINYPYSKLIGYNGIRAVELIHKL